VIRPDHGVVEAIATLRAVQGFQHVVRVLDRPAVDGQQQVAAAQSGFRGGTARGNLRRDDALGPGRPEHAVLHLVPARTHGDVRGGERQQARHDDERQRVTAHRRGGRVSAEGGVRGRSHRNARQASSRDTSARGKA